MNGIAELEVYIKLKDLELKYPYTDIIQLSDGNLDSSGEYAFDIKRNEYKKLEQIRGDYHFEFRDNEYPCSIVALTSTQVRLKIEGSQERTIDSGAIKVDMSNIIKREKQGLCQLKDETDPTMRRLLFGKKKISGAEQSECEFENEELNFEQKQAIMYAVGVQDMYLIWGPPGTGKTTIAPEIVSNYVRLHLEENQKIMVCSYTNKAVDNVVQKLFDDNRFRNNIVRFGDSTLTGKYKDARFDEQLKKKQNEIKEELEERIRQLRSEKEGIEEKLKLNRKEIERVEKEKEDAKGEIDTLNAEIAHTKELITDKERSLLKINLKEEIARINDELPVCRDNLREFTIKKEKNNREIKELSISVSRLEDVTSDIYGRLNKGNKQEEDMTNILRIVEYYLDFTEGLKSEIKVLSAEVPHIRKLIANMECSLLKSHLEEEISKIDRALKEYHDNLKENSIKKKEIEKEIEGLDIEIPRLKGDIDTIHEQLDQSRNEEIDIANIILVVNYYLKCSKRNKFVAFLKKSAFTRQNPLYERYKQKIIDLDLSRRNRIELEKILQKKQEGQRKEQEVITKLQNDLNALENIISEKERDFALKKEKLMAIDGNQKSLSENIKSGEKRLDKFNNDLESLAHGKLEYDRAALIREYPKLHELYGDLSKKKDRILVIWKKFKQRRQKLLYEQYKQDIFDLQLPRRNRDELEKIIYEKSEEQKNEQEKIAKFQEELNEKERELREKERKLIATKDELKSVEKSYASLSEKIQRGEKEQGELRRNLDLLAQDKLKYDRATLTSGNKELNELYGELRNKEGTNKQKEVIFSSTGQKISSLKVVDEQLSDSIREINDKIKAERRNMQREMDERMEKARLAVLNEKQIIATTNLRACDRLFENETIKFDLIIMDEAGAIDLPGAVIPILKGNKYIFLGDPDQLPPIINDDIGKIRDFLEGKPGLRASIFKKLFKTDYGNNQAIMLKSQYRMKREIADVVSKLYYEGLLRTPRDIKEKLGYIQDDKIVSNRYPMICFQRRFWTEYENRSAFSEHEIRFVRNIIERFKESYGDDIVDDIAIISPYRAQTNMITEEIPEIDCGTVHTFQGQEKTIIIFATAKYRRNTDGSFGKLLQGSISKNLLNVAVSRAREKFIIIGSKELFEEVPIYKALYEHIRGGGYVAPAHINGYDFENRCEMCGEVISEEYRFCRRCLVLHRLRNFLDERPRTFRAVDGDLLRSSDEVRIDDWFYRNGIEHEVERRVPVDRLRYCDWFLPRGEIYVEYWGLMDEEWYREAREVREELYRQANLRLISIEPNDMRDLDDALGQIFRDIR